MGKYSVPHRGSLGFWPRKRAKRIYPRIKSRPNSSETKLQEFAGYKVGMTHVMMIGDKKNSATHNRTISVPVTVIECPPLKVAGVRVYGMTPYGRHALGEAWAEKLDKNLSRKVATGKKKGKLEDLEKIKENVKEVRLLVHSVPKNSGVSKKTPELFEIEIAGENVDEKLKFAGEKMGGEIRIDEVFEEGALVDAVAVSKGKGWAGSVKRHGVKILSHKARKVKRKAGNLGAWTPKKTSWTVPQMGQLGFHARTELNKRILKISGDPSEIKVSGGWLNYGEVKSQFIVVRGSVPGPAKRLVRMRSAIRPQSATYDKPQITSISLDSKQGR